mmetsp:Transcript_55591/g.124225  ORF Transcript_55591/g.124225 Transcript_55591/m.124225 type:complete len:200 (-) Transcript_55591:419-1018(-)
MAGVGAAKASRDGSTGSFSSAALLLSISGTGKAILSFLPAVSSDSTAGAVPASSSLAAGIDAKTTPAEACHSIAGAGAAMSVSSSVGAVHRDAGAGANTSPAETCHSIAGAGAAMNASSSARFVHRAAGAGASAASSSASSSAHSTGTATEVSSAAAVAGATTASASHSSPKVLAAAPRSLPRRSPGRATVWTNSAWPA